MKQFIKDDHAKRDFTMLEYGFIDGVSKVLEHGEQKYDRLNWKQASKADGLFRYTKALMRHVLAFALKHEWLDPSSGLPHIYHAACCIMFIGFYWFKDNKHV